MLYSSCPDPSRYELQMATSRTARSVRSWELLQLEEWIGNQRQWPVGPCMWRNIIHLYRSDCIANLRSRFTQVDLEAIPAISQPTNILEITLTKAVCLRGQRDLRKCGPGPRNSDSVR